MTANFNERRVKKHPHDRAPKYHACSMDREMNRELTRIEGSTEDAYQSPGVLDNLKRDRFELISAYLDGEVTAEERRQVEEWLKYDTSVQGLYQRLLTLRQRMKTIPTPPREQSAHQVAEAVVGRVDRQPKVALLWSGAAVAALLLAVVSDWGMFRPGAIAPVAEQPGTTQITPLAESGSDFSMVDSDALMIALDQPIFEIPKAPSSPVDSAQPTLYTPGTDVRH